MKQFKLRASAAGHFLSQPKKKADREAGELSATAKANLISYFLGQRYNYRDIIINDDLLKGTYLEADSISFLDSVFPVKSGPRVKNLTRFNDRYFTGEPDIILPDCIEDIKTVRDIKSLFTKKITKEYATQLQVYMYLTGKTKARLIYVLIHSPVEHIIKKEDSIFRQMEPFTDHAEEMIKQIKENYNVHNVPEKERFRIFEIEYVPGVIAILKDKHFKAIEFLNDLEIETKKLSQWTL